MTANSFVLLCIALILSSCSIYQQRLDSYPDQGIASTAVSDLEQMIIETQEGPDIFSGTNLIKREGKGSAERIWVHDHKKSHFIYFQEQR